MHNIVKFKVGDYKKTAFSFSIEIHNFAQINFYYYMQKQLKSLLFGITFLCWLVGLQAQDIHFSQFYMSPLNLNPAMTGVMNCNVRVSGIYRSQWSSILRSNAYSTYSVSYDQRIPVGRYDYFGVGGTFWGDKAGESQFATIQGKLSGSFRKKNKIQM